MAPVRLLLVFLGFFGGSFFFLSWMPVVPLVIDPLLLLLVFLGLRFPSVRFLWLMGAGMGLLKETAAGGLFGASMGSFAAIGWVLGSARHWVELDDPLAQGIWTAGMVGLAFLIEGILNTLADPWVGWNRWWWGMTPLAMGVNGMLAAWGFPRLKRILAPGR